MGEIVADGRRLVDERRRRRLTQLQAAVAMGISPQTLRRAENGLGVQPKSLEEICRFYGLEVSVVAA